MPKFIYDGNFNTYDIIPGDISLKKVYFDWLQFQNDESSELVVVFDFIESVLEFKEFCNDNQSERRLKTDAFNYFFKYENYFFIRKVLEFFVLINNSDPDKELILRKGIARKVRNYFLGDIKHTGSSFLFDGYYPAIIIEKKGSTITRKNISVINNTLEPFNPNFPDNTRTFVKFSDLKETFFEINQQERKED